MSKEIESELKRLIGPEGVEVTEIETAEEANRQVRLETSDACYHLPANQLLLVLRELPDRVGILGLRSAIERHFPAHHRT